MFHPLMRVWIEIALIFIGIQEVEVSPSYEGVDWNGYTVYLFLIGEEFHPLMRVWIEINSNCNNQC